MANDKFEEVTGPTAGRSTIDYTDPQKGARKAREVNKIADELEPYADLTPDQLKAALSVRTDHEAEEAHFNSIRAAGGAKPVDYAGSSWKTPDLPAADRPMGKGGMLAPPISRPVDPNAIDTSDTAMGIGAKHRRGEMQPGSTSSALFTRFNGDAKASHDKAVKIRLSRAYTKPLRDAFKRHEDLHRTGAACGDVSCESHRRDLANTTDPVTKEVTPLNYTVRHFQQHHAQQGSMLYSAMSASRDAATRLPENQAYEPMTEEEYRSNPATQSVEQKYMVAHAAGVTPDVVHAFASLRSPGTKAAGSASGLPSSLPQVQKSKKNWTPPSSFLWAIGDLTHQNTIRGLYEIQKGAHKAKQGHAEKAIRGAKYSDAEKQEKLSKISAKNTRYTAAWNIVKNGIKAFASGDNNTAQSALTNASVREVMGAGEGRARGSSASGYKGPQGALRPSRTAAASASASNAASELTALGNATAESAGTTTDASRLSTSVDGGSTAPADRTRGGRRRNVLNQRQRSVQDLTEE